MFKATCIYKNLTEIPNYTDDLVKYKNFVKPIDYDFGLSLGADYLVMGFFVINEISNIFLVPALATNSSKIDTLEVALIALFSIHVTKFPENLVKHNLEVIPKSFAHIPHWFERYMNEEDMVVEVVEKEIQLLQAEAKKYLI